MRIPATFLVLGLVAGGCGGAAETPPTAQPPAGPGPIAATQPATKTLTKTTPSADYPLKTCVVSGEELGAMGERVAYTYEGTEVQFCCPDCVGKFEKDPEKYLSQIRAARK